MKIVGWLLGLALIGLSAGFGGNISPAPAAPPPPVAQAAPPPSAAQVSQVSKEFEARPLPPIPYERKGRRDPFRPLPSPVPEEEPELQLYSVKLVGIVQGREGPMALVEGPEGLGHILKKGDALAEGRVTEIGTDSVTVRVVKRPGEAPTPYVLQLIEE